MVIQRKSLASLVCFWLLLLLLLLLSLQSLGDNKNPLCWEFGVGIFCTYSRGSTYFSVSWQIMAKNGLQESQLNSWNFWTVLFNFHHPVAGEFSLTIHPQQTPKYKVITVECPTSFLCVVGRMHPTTVLNGYGGFLWMVTLHSLFSLTVWQFSFYFW